VDNKRHRVIELAAVGLIVLGTGACQQPPAEDNSAPAPVSQRPVRPKPGSEGQPGPGAQAGTPAKPGGPSAMGKRGPGAQAKGGKKSPGASQQPGGPPQMARGSRDPFAPQGARPGAPGAGPATPPPPRIIAYTGRRKDPFYIDWKLPVPPPYVFDEVEPIRLASDYVPTPPSQPFEVREQPEMRVSGIMTGDGVFAILESGGDKVDVVKPGSSVEVSVGGQTKRTYKVVSITKDKVKLRSQVGNVIYTQEVPLSDVAVGVAARTGAPGAFGGPFGSGGPGAGPGGVGSSGGPIRGGQGGRFNGPGSFGGGKGRLGGGGEK